MGDRIGVAVLGATGLVGQMFVRLLDEHPWFQPVHLAASPAKRGARYGEAVDWSLGGDPPAWARGMVLGDASRPQDLPGDVELVFSALPREASAPVEAELARRGLIVVSNASSMRMEPDVPLLNPEVNHEHLGLLDAQRARRGWRGALLKVPNCSTAILTLSLAPIIGAAGARRILVTTMQAVSGAGLRGLPSHAILGNVVPFIRGEEEKIEAETRKILGAMGPGGIRPLDTPVTATATRVPVLDGHLEAVYLEAEKSVDEEALRGAVEGYSPLKGLGLPTAPAKPLAMLAGLDRPQPRLDAWRGGGMTVSLGRLRVHGGWVAYVALGHNLVRGAAGTGILIAELYAREEGII